MNYKDELGIDPGCRSIKISDEMVTEREGKELAAKGKQIKEEKRKSDIKIAFGQTLHQKVSQGNITASQASRLERGEDPRRIFK